MKVKLLWALIAIILLGIAQSTAPLTAHACSCGKRRTPVQVLRQADAVFVGKVIAREEQQYKPQDSQSYTLYSWTFEVTSALKGVIGSHVIVSEDFSICNYGFDLGESYLVYAYRDQYSDNLYPDRTTKYGDRFYSSVCAPNAPLAKAGDDLAQLELYKWPISPAPWPLPFLLLLVLVVLLYREVRKWQRRSHINT
jgi:hypothetical protein